MCHYRWQLWGYWSAIWIQGGAPLGYLAFFSLNRRKLIEQLLALQYGQPLAIETATIADHTPSREWRRVASQCQQSSRSSTAAK